MALAKSLSYQHYGPYLIDAGRAGVVVDPDGELVVRGESWPVRQWYPGSLAGSAAHSKRWRPLPAG